MAANGFDYDVIVIGSGAAANLEDAYVNPYYLEDLKRRDA